MSSILGASVAPYIAAWLQGNYGLAAVGTYLAAMAALTLIALPLTHETRHQLASDLFALTPPASGSPCFFICDKWSGHWLLSPSCRGDQRQQRGGRRHQGCQRRRYR